MGGALFFYPEWGKVHNFMLICYMKYSTVNKMPQIGAIMKSQSSKEQSKLPETGHERSLMKVQKILDRDGMNAQVMINGHGQVVGTWALFSEMNDITLAYNLGGLPEEWLNKVPKSFISLWEKWQDRQSGNSYWENPLHC